MAARQPGRPGGGTGPDVRQRALAALGERLRAGPVTGQDWASWLEQVSQGIASQRSALPAGTPAGEALEWLARRYGFAIERKPCPDSGRTIWTQRLIWVSPESDDHAAARAILHQLGHVAAARLTQVLADCGPACRGVRKAEADSFAYLISARMGLDVASFSFAAPELWAGRDPRAHPEATILAVAGRIIAAAAPAMQQLPGGARERRPERGQPAAVTARPTGAKLAPGLVRGEPAQAGLFRVLADAHRFYRASAAGSWVPAYFTERGIGPDIGQQWQAGYAPASWTATIGFLRDRGHDPGLIEAAGAFRRPS